AFLRHRLAKLGTERAGAAIVILGLIPMGIDGFTQLFRVNNYESTPLARVVTGGLAGFVGGLLVAAMLVTIRQFSIEMQALQARASRARRDADLGGAARPDRSETAARSHRIVQGEQRRLAHVVPQQARPRPHASTPGVERACGRAMVRAAEVARPQRGRSPWV